MKLKVLDQIHISAVKADSLRPGEEFEVSYGYGKELLHRHPGRLAAVGSKAKRPHANKAATSPANKSIS